MQKLIWIAIGLLILLQVYTLFFKDNSKNIVYVDLVNAFDEFAMKKELEAVYRTEINQTQKLVDSLTLNFQVLNERWERDNENESLLDSLKVKWRNLENLKKSHEQRSSSLKEKYDSQIQNQMTQYLKDFGDMEGYEIVMGVMEGTEVIYSRPTNDVTKKAILFINKKYDDR